MPVTIGTIHKAEQDTNDDTVFRHEGLEFSQIRTIGCIVEMREQSTNILYIIEDGTGRIECKVWLETDQEETTGDGRSKCVEGTYVRVVGTVKVFNGKRNVSAFNVRPIHDFNEITHHGLETIHVHLKAKGGAAAPGAGASVGGVAPPSKTFEGGASVGGGGAESIQSDVLKVFTQHSSMDNKGLDIKRAIEMLLPKGYNAADIRKAIGFLTDEGHLYSTVDENHLKSTENC